MTIMIQNPIFLAPYSVIRRQVFAIIDKHNRRKHKQDVLRKWGSGYDNKNWSTANTFNQHCRKSAIGESEMEGVALNMLLPYFYPNLDSISQNEPIMNEVELVVVNKVSNEVQTDAKQ